MTAVPEAARCSTCGHPLTAFCARCRGRVGGRATSPRKTRAARKNAAQRRPRARVSLARRAQGREPSGPPGRP